MAITSSTRTSTNRNRADTGSNPSGYAAQPYLLQPIKVPANLTAGNGFDPATVGVVPGDLVLTGAVLNGDRLFVYGSDSLFLPISADVATLCGGRHNANKARNVLLWTAGQYGKPGISTDLTSAVEATSHIADHEFLVEGTNCVSTCTALATTGGVTMTTTGAIGDQVILTGHSTAGASNWGNLVIDPAKEPIFYLRFSTAADIADAIIWAGLKKTNTPVITTDTDQAFIRYEAGVNTTWNVVTSIANADTETDSTYTVTASKMWELLIAFDSARLCYVMLNDVDLPMALMKTTAAMTASAPLHPFLGVQTAANAAKAITVHAMGVSILAV